MYLLDLASLTVLASCSVSLWTIRVALTARGRRRAAAVAASIEAVTFVVAFGRALDSLDSPIRMAAYGLGVGAGTLLGLAAEQRFETARARAQRSTSGSSDGTAPSAVSATSPESSASQCCAT
jgi:uncharacterized protein YebE (UPF0316 family)